MSVIIQLKVNIINMLDLKLGLVYLACCELFFVELKSVPVSRNYYINLEFIYFIMVTFLNCL